MTSPASRLVAAVATNTSVMCAIAAVAIATPAANASPIDIVTITGSLAFPELADGENDGSVYYRLTGQSAYYNTRTGSFATGNQLDGLTSYDAEVEDFQIIYTEFFPETNLTDYLQFGYFGVVETVSDTGNGETILASTLIVAGHFSEVEGQTIDAILPFFSVSGLVNALIGGFDTDEFFDALFSAVGNPALMGDITLYQFDGGQAVDVLRYGQGLGLFAFIGGDNGDEAVAIGSLETSVLRIVPTPSTIALGAVACFISASRRRRNAP